MRRKLESARHRYGSVKSTTVADIEELLQVCCATQPSEAELLLWRLVKKDADKPFSVSNATWIKRGCKQPPAQPTPPAAPEPRRHAV